MNQEVGIEPAAPTGDMPAETVAAIAPGMALRLAREAKGHSVADVVQVIRFSHHQIEALERDDYSGLPGATSVRGLVRNYAKFLKLDPEPLLAQLTPAVPVPEADVRPPTNMGEADQESMAARFPLRIVIAVFAALVLGLGVVWFVTSPTEAVPKLSLQPSGGGVKGRASSPGEQSMAIPVTGSPATGSVSSQTSAEAAAVPPTGLRVEFDERSWIEVRDASQKIVLVGEFPGGSKHDVEGRPPFQLWIGRASAVRVYMGERGVDLKPHTREEVARLTVE